MHFAWQLVCLALWPCLNLQIGLKFPGRCVSIDEMGHPD